MAELVYQWNVWETQTMVLVSFMLQLFLLATGSLRRRNTNRVLKALIWLAYVGADFAAVYALGLFSQYEDKYKQGRESLEDTLPFLWVPFLLVHLGGQDSITAFSLEDNNLWLRHLLNLATQGVLALYVFWKSFHRINYSILIPAMLVFISGIIKYGERVWALKSSSRNGLGESVKFNSLVQNNREDVPEGAGQVRTEHQLGSTRGSPPTNDVPVYPSKESYALQIVLLARGLFVGRTVLQLGGKAVGGKFKDSFQKYDPEGKLKIVEMELGMMFDLLYTKANVLQRWTGVLFQCASQTLMGVAFLLCFLPMRSEKVGAHHHKVNVVISYTLFTGAIFMEACSVAVVITSPWTRAHLNKSSFLHGLCNFATSLFNAVQCNKGHRTMSSISMGQFNLMDYCIDMKYKPKIVSKAISAIGLDKQWRNLCYVHQMDDASGAKKRIINCVLEILCTPANGPLSLDRGLRYTLIQPFEHVLYRLHIYTDLHISRYHANTNSNATTMQLKEECEILSNYMMYLMVVHPSMLPVSTAAEDLEAELLKWVAAEDLEAELLKWVAAEDLEAELLKGAGTIKHQILEYYTSSKLGDDPEAPHHFKPKEIINESSQLEEPLEVIKKMWLRLLMYAAGKCRGELHARQLGEGGEFITFVWLLMVHHGLGDVARELRIFTSNDPSVGQPGLTVSNGYSEWVQREDPLYAFKFHDDPDERRSKKRQRLHGYRA